MKTKLQVLVWMVALPLMARAQVNYYVATNGNNANAGTSTNAPLATLSAARDKIRTLTTDLTILDGATELTIAGWVYPNSKGANIGILTCTGPTYFGMLFSGAGVGNPLEMRANNNSLRAPDNSCPAGQWHHVAGVWKSGAIQKLYINGVEVADDSTPPTGVISADNWYLGSDRVMSSRYLNGNTKEMRVWARALSAAEIQGLTNTPPTVPPTVVLSRTNQETFTGSQAIVLNQIPLANGANVWIRGGRYAVTNTLSLDGQDTGKPGAPIVYSSFPGEQVIFDGGRAINPLGFALVTDAPTLAKLNTLATNNVFAQTISDATLISLLTNTSSQLSQDERMAQVARYPNIGFGTAANINTTGETNNVDGTFANPAGASFRFVGNYATNKWNAELVRLQRARVIGYVSADWLKETLRVHSVSAAGITKLMDGTSYDFGNASVERPFIDQLLCELDEPGEWYFDPTDNKLYLWPRTPLTAASSVSVWAGPAVFNLDGGCSYTHIKRLTIQHLSSGGGVDIRSGTGNLVAGCTMRNIAPGANAFNLWGGTSNRILSCDVYDVDNASRLYGGSANNAAVTLAGNVIENCHFTQVYSKSLYGKVCGVSGAGNIFRHNLSHNHNGQIITIGGNDHLFEFNETFNTGIEEGDGGSFYQGIALQNWGNRYEHNFWHHVISIPSLIARSALFADGGIGMRVKENVFYKAAEAVKSTSGCGHTLNDNVFIRNTYSFHQYPGSGSETPTALYNTSMNHLDTDPLFGDKFNQIGNGMRTFGIANWNTTIKSTNWINYATAYWTNRYPDMNRVLNAWWTAKAMNKLGWVTNSILQGNTTGSGSGMSYPGTTTVVGSQTLADLSAFMNPGTLNFKYKPSRPPNTPDLPFQDIGLYLDEYRTWLPDKDTYRALAAGRWASVESAPSGSYDPNTINARIYYNSGADVLELATLPTYSTTPNLYAFYSFDDSANRFKDDSGNERHITSSSGTVTWGTSTGFKNSGAYDFGGGRLIAPINVSPTNLPLMTWGAWVRTDVLTGVNRYKFLGQDDGPWDRSIGLDPRYYANPGFGSEGTLITTNTAFRYTTFTGTNEVFKYGGPIPNTPAPTNSGQWSFVAATYDQSNQWVTFHIDLDASTTNDALQSFRVRGFFTSGFNTLAIGGLRPDNANEAWDGAIDNVFIYDGVLGEAQLSNLRNQGKSAFVTVPVTAPVISSITRNLDGTILLAWSSDLFPTTYAVLTSTNAALPVAAWTVENATIPSGGATTSYTTGTAYNNIATFFRVRRNQ